MYITFIVYKTVVEAHDKYLCDRTNKISPSREDFLVYVKIYAQPKKKIFVCKIIFRKYLTQSHGVLIFLVCLYFYNKLFYYCKKQSCFDINR